MSFPLHLRSLLILVKRHRQATLAGVQLDLRQRYAGSVLGLAWAFLYPVILLSIYSITYTFILKVRPSGLTEYQYVALVFSGLVPLLAFNEAVMSSVSSLTSNRALLTNTVFPPELIPVRAVLAAVIPSIFAAAIATLIGVILANGLSFALVLIPVLWVLLICFILGIAWVLSLVCLAVRDIQQLLALILMVLMIVSPAAYTPEMVPNSLKVLIYLNPMSYFIICFQQIICYGLWPSWHIFVIAVALSATSFIGGYIIFRKTKAVFFDYA